jgi:3,4-dihydroxy 2-butanone 4-phosphate synthase/GTP cyclohydrolase II
MLSVADIVRHRLRRERLVRHVAEARVPTRRGPFTFHPWGSLTDGTEHLAFVEGEPAGVEPVLVRVRSECLTGDVFGSARCDCGAQLDDAMAAIAAVDRNVVLAQCGIDGGYARHARPAQSGSGRRREEDADGGLGAGRRRLILASSLPPGLPRLTHSRDRDPAPCRCRAVRDGR